MKFKNSASLVIIIICVLVFLVQNGIQAATGYDLLSIYGAKINDLILAGQLWRFITPVFLHGSILHLSFNMYALYAIGPSMERRYGVSSFLLLFIISGIFGNIFSFLFSPNASLGSSTAIFGLIAAQGVYIYKNRLLLGSAANALLRNVLMVVAVNLVLGLSPGVDNWGHLGGLFGGFLFAWFAGPSYGMTTNVFGDNVIFKENKKTIWVTTGLFLTACLLVFLKFLLA